MGGRRTPSGANTLGDCCRWHVVRRLVRRPMQDYAAGVVGIGTTVASGGTRTRVCEKRRDRSAIRRWEQMARAITASEVRERVWLATECPWE